jgi:hypothetical protein
MFSKGLTISVVRIEYGESTFQMLKIVGALSGIEHFDFNVLSDSTAALTS